MKKSIILSLSLLIFAVVFCGCQTPAEGPTDKQLINTAMTEWKAALEARDLDRLMALFSDNYVSSSGDGKVAMRERTAGAIERGSLDNIKVKIENAKITLVGDQATFGGLCFGHVLVVLIAHNVSSSAKIIASTSSRIAMNSGDALTDRALIPSKN